MHAACCCAAGNESWPAGVTPRLCGNQLASCPPCSPQVCNHPDLFEGRPIVSAFDMQPLQLRLPNAVPWLLQQRGPFEAASLGRFLVQPPGGSQDRTVLHVLQVTVCAEDPWQG